MKIDFSIRKMPWLSFEPYVTPYITIKPFEDFWRWVRSHICHSFLLQLNDFYFLLGESTNKWINNADLFQFVNFDGL